MLFFTPALIALMALGHMTSARPTSNLASELAAQAAGMTLAEAQARLAGFEQRLPGLEAAIQDHSSLEGIKEGVFSYMDGLTGGVFIGAGAFFNFMVDIEVDF